MKTLDRNDERIVKAIIAKYAKLKMTYTKNEERMNTIDEEYRQKAEQKKQQLKAENENLYNQLDSIDESMVIMYEANVEQLMQQFNDDDAIVDDTQNYVDPTSDNEEPVSDDLEVTDEETVEEQEEEDGEENEDVATGKIEDDDALPFDVETAEVENVVEETEEQEVNTDDEGLLWNYNDFINN